MTDLAVQTPDDETKLAEIKADAQEIVDDAIVLKVTNPEQLATANEYLGTLKQALTGIDKARRFRTDPLNDFVTWWNNGFRAITEPMVKAQVNLKGEVGKYLIAKEEKVQKAAAAAEEKKRKAEEEAAEKKAEAEKAAKAGDTAAAAKATKAAEAAETAAAEVAPVEAAQTTVRGTGGTTSLKKVWTYNVEDIEKVPAKYLAVDGKAIMKEVNAGEREIAGLKIFQEAQVAHRR